MEANALIIFARKPLLGKVKTRLAADVGDEVALRIYKRLLEHTRDVALHARCDTFVFLTELPADAFWDGFRTRLQPDGDLGDKMLEAFRQLLRDGYKRVVIVGSDCPHLESADIDDAFSALAIRDVVLGPAADGGYYLLGMKRLHDALFRNKAWSSETVFTQTMESINDNGLSCAMLRELHDVDEVADVPVGWLEP